MVAPAVAKNAAPVILGMSPDRILKRYTLPKEVAGWTAVKGKHLSPQSSTPGPQKARFPQDIGYNCTIKLLALCMTPHQDVVCHQVSCLAYILTRNTMALSCLP